MLSCFAKIIMFLVQALSGIYLFNAVQRKQPSTSMSFLEYLTESAPFVHFHLQEQIRHCTQVAAGNRTAAAVVVTEHTLAVRML
jgi:hypothetical protein